MKPVIFLRVASVLTLIHAVLHTIGGVFGKVEPGPAAVAVAAMKANQVLVMGSLRSFWDFYHGMGLAATIALTTDGIAFWLLGSLAKKDAARLRPVMAVFLLSYLAMAVNSKAYFFIAPVITEILIAACLAVALVTAKSGVSVRDREGERVHA